MRGVEDNHWKDLAEERLVSLLREPIVGITPEGKQLGGAPHEENISFGIYVEGILAVTSGNKLVHFHADISRLVTSMEEIWDWILASYSILGLDLVPISVDVYNEFIINADDPRTGGSIFPDGELEFGRELWKVLEC
jgi:hypothetical protein